MDLQKAKEMFVYFGGSHFQMHREDENEYYKYKAVGVPREMEMEWRREMQIEILKKLQQATSNMDKALFFGSYGHLVEDLGDQSGFQFMLNYIRENEDFFDSQTMLISISAIVDIARKKEDKQHKVAVLNEVILILKRMLNKPITVSDEYRDENESSILQYYLTDAGILESIQRKIEYCESLLHEKKPKRRLWEFFK